MKLTATQEFRFAGRQLQAGDDFEANDRDARVLLAIEKAIPARPKKRATKTRTNATN